MTDYKAMTELEQGTALLNFGKQLRRTKQREDWLKKNPPSNQNAVEYVDELQRLKADASMTSQEIKRFWKQVMP